MTGKELILYILQNDLEDTVIFEDDFFGGFMTTGEAAVKFGVGEATIQAWHHYNMLKGFRVNNHLYFHKDAVDPRTDCKTINQEKEYEQ